MACFTRPERRFCLSSKQPSNPHHRRLYSKIARQVYAMIQWFYNVPADSRILSAAVIA
jgi:hypothetical protein